MLLSITNLLTGDFLINDPSGLTNFNAKVGPSSTKSGLKITEDAFVRVEPLLEAAKTASKITYQVTDDPLSIADDQANNVRTALTTPVTADVHDEVIVTNLTVPAAVLVNLPTALPIGKILEIVDGKGDGATNNVTLDPEGAGTINGAATLALSTNYGHARIVKIGATAWLRLPG